MHNKKRLMEITIKTKKCDSTCRSLKKLNHSLLTLVFVEWAPRRAKSNSGFVFS